MAKLVVSLLTYNSKQYLSDCLTSIANQTFRDFELYCRDNNSSDGSAEVVRATYSSAHVVQSSTNDGFARGHNATIRETDSEYLCILNHDLILDANYFQDCVAFLDAHPHVASVSGMLARMHPLTVNGKGDMIDSSGIVFGKTGRAVNLYAGKPLALVSQPLRVLGVAATAAIYRRTAIEDIAIDGEIFDEDFFMYKEDVDLALRLKLRGWEAYTIPRARAWHVRSTDQRILARRFSFINRLSYRNHWFILIKSVPREQYFVYGPLIALFELAKFFYLLVAERSTLRVLGDVWRLRKKMFAKREIIMSRQKESLFLHP